VTPALPDQTDAVLAFWFGETRPRQWFAKDAAFDGLVLDRFLGLIRQALAGELDAWSMEPPGGLALVLLLDQFPRQIWRDTAMAFAGDPQVLADAADALGRPGGAGGSPASL
jgi:uncharacterized protein (DUF924 family)